MSIRSRLTFIFLAIALIPTILIAALTFINYARSIEKHHISSLEDIVAFKADKINTYFKGLENSIKMAQNFWMIRKNLPILTRLSGDTSKAEFMSAKEALDEQLRPMQYILDLYEIILVEPTGKIVYTSNPRQYPKHLLRSLQDSEQKAFSEGKTGVYFTDIFLDEMREGKPALLISAPVLGSDGLLVGVIVFEVNMTQFYNLVQDTTGLGNTGETLLCKKIGNEILFLNPLRHDPKATLTKKIRIGEKTAIPAQRAVLGVKGGGHSTDYRNRDVIAAWDYIPSSEWGIVAKIDCDEAFTDVTTLRNFLIGIFVFVLVLSAAASFYIAKTTAGTLERLSREISERKKIENELEQYRGHLEELARERTTELEETNKQLDAFNYSVSHDLRAPLRSIDGFSRMLLEDYGDKLDDAGKHNLVTIRKNVKKMGLLIEDLLRFAHLGRQKVQMRHIDMEKIVKCVLEDMKDEITPDRTLKIDIKDIPPANGDPSLMHHVWYNILSNAAKFTRSKKMGTIEIGCISDAKENKYYVKDNGVGFDMKYMDKLFEIFQRLHDEAQFEGTGVGLAIARQIIDRHGGRIWAEGKTGEGATFYFALPKKGGNHGNKRSG
ncbi:MAG: ATP-binding protein [Candidatus Omnitrophota bacterium]|nr:ATP-binding protein [Candidatus Omnitrophota bacterium]